MNKKEFKEKYKDVIVRKYKRILEIYFYIAFIYSTIFLLFTPIMFGLSLSLMITIILMISIYIFFYLEKSKLESDKITLKIDGLKIKDCPYCGCELDGCVVDSTEEPYMCCGNCGLIFDNFPKQVEFINENKLMYD